MWGSAAVLCACVFVHTEWTRCSLFSMAVIHVSKCQKAETWGNSLCNLTTPVAAQWYFKFVSVPSGKYVTLRFWGLDGSGTCCI